MKISQKAAVLPPVEHTLRSIGRSVRALRRARRLTIGSAAAQAGVSASTMNRIERGDPSVSIGAYASVFHALDVLGAIERSILDKMTKALNLFMDEHLPKRARAQRSRYDF
jgi:transcriptional regulator with XRE-family HTH domain